MVNSVIKFSIYSGAYQKEETAVIRVPKAELHIHLEGSILPNIVRKMAWKNGIALSRGYHERG